MLEDPFRGSVAVAAGLVTWRRLQGPGFRRVYPDVYAPRGIELDLLNRSLAAYRLVADRDGVLAGYSAALLLGVDCAPRNAPAEVLVPRFMRPVTGLRIGYQRTPEEDLTEVRGCRVTTHERTAWDLGRRLSLVEAVVAVDALARAGRFDPAQLLTRRAKQPGAPGCQRLDEVVTLSRPRSESPMETRLRLALFRAELPEPEVQYEILDRDWNLVARIDLAYQAAKLAIEYDGASHSSRGQRESDIRRDALLARYGWLTLRLTRRDVTTNLERTIRNIQGALRTRAA